MNADQYREHLRAHGVNETILEGRISAIQAFENWLAQLGTDITSAGKKEVGQYAKRLIAEGANTPENYDILCDYALWLHLRALYVALVEVADCHNGMEVLSDAIEKQHGADVRDRIFMEPLPKLGAEEAERIAHTKKITSRMAALLTPEEARAAWFQVQHGIPQEYWQKHDAGEREKYAACETVDSFLKQARENRNAMLTRMHDQDELWFTMELTDEVLDYLVNEVHMKMGENNGRKGIVITKVPYRAGRFLHETDETLKRYYACHCPLIREAILRGETVPDDVCYCSLGHASHFLAGMGLDHLKGEVLESVVKGGARCRFIFYLPEKTGD